MAKIKKKQNPFSLIIAISTLIFIIILFLSIPFLYNYKSEENEIEKKFYSEFKIKLKILDEISYNYFPNPHLLIKKANLGFNLDDKKFTVIDTENLKIYMPFNSVFRKSSIDISGLEIKNTNFNFNFLDIKKFRDHLFYNINKPIKIKNSKFFYLDNKKQTILISPIYSLNYSINEKSNYKNFSIKGNIFDVDYNSTWKRYYESPKITHHEIVFQKPNLSVKNLFLVEGEKRFSGNSLITFLKESIDIEYKIRDSNIYINSNDELKNQKIKILSTTELKPFYSDSSITFINKDFNFLIDFILNYLLNADKEILGNFSGKIALNFSDLDNEIINSGKININISEKNISLKNANFLIENAASIKSKFNYYEKEGDLIFKSNNELKITNKEEFAKKLQLSPKKFNNIDKIFFDLEKNIEKDEFYILNLRINNADAENKLEDSITLKNIKLLRNLLNKIAI